jgi:hypothetical protein
LPTELPNKRVVSTVDISALRHEIAALQQLCSVLFQEPLDRSRACFVRTNVDIADALCHLRTVVPSTRRGQFLPLASIQFGRAFGERVTLGFKPRARTTPNSGYNPTY